METQRTTIVVYVGKENGVDQAAVLCSLLGDRSDPRNRNYALRVVAFSDQVRSFFVNSKTGNCVAWRCHEQRLVAWPSTVKTHVGAPDTVLSSLESAISGRDTHDDGGVADVILLCCSLGERLVLLRSLARVLYRLDESGVLLSSQAPPLLLGTLGPTRGMDWIARLAFCAERPAHFVRWKRSLALFGLDESPFDCHIAKPGLVMMLSPSRRKLRSAVCPSLPFARRHTRHILEPILQQQVQYRTMNEAEQMHQPDDDDTNDDCALSITDLADPYASLPFLSCTLHDSQSIILSCLLFSLIEDLDQKGNDLTSLSPQSIDASRSKPSLGQLVLDIVQEWYALLDRLDDVLSPLGYTPISSPQDGGVLSSILGSFICNVTGNSPQEVAERSGGKASASPHGGIHYRRLMERLVSYNLRCVPVLSSDLAAPDSKDSTNDLSQLCADQVPHGVCIIALGLGELLGMDLTTEMPKTLQVVRKLQCWMEKEYVLPTGCIRIVGGARNVGETFAPQAFGLRTIQELKRFLLVSPSGHISAMDSNSLANSPILTSMNQSRL